MVTTELSERGCQIIPHVLPGVECDHLIARLSETDVARGRAGARHLLSIPEVEQVARDPRLVDIIRDAIGLEAVPFRATLFEKTQETNWLIAWHQDTALPLEERFESPGWGPWSIKAGIHYAHAPAWAINRVVVLRLHLDHSEPDNGSLRVLPGSHRHGVLTDEAIHHLANETAAVECVVPKGGVLAMRPLIVHASSKSTGPPRRVLHFEYANSRTLRDKIHLAVA
jgi:ectoine hydroxylase-related dioxygenase (phytanoyl-CoA dioxygenase family)